MVDLSLCSRGGKKNQIGRLVVFPMRIYARSMGWYPGACTALSAKVCYVTNISLRSGKPAKIPWRAHTSLCTNAQPHTRLSASAPLCRTGRWSSGEDSCSGNPRISLTRSQFHSTPICYGQDTAPGLEPDMGQDVIQIGTGP